MDMFTIPEALVCKNHYNFIFSEKQLYFYFKKKTHCMHHLATKYKAKDKSKKKNQFVNSTIKEA